MLEPCEGKLSRTVLRGEIGSNTADLLDQILENKQKFISQIMTSKSPVRACEDVDDAALTYAEIKALATGNPYIKEKMDLDIQVSKLKLMKANHTSQIYRLETDIARNYPMQITSMKERIAGLNADWEVAKSLLQKEKDDFSITVSGKVYTDRKEAGTALIVACSGLKTVQVSGTVGEFHGFSLSAAYDSFNQCYNLTIKGKCSYTVEVGKDALGNIMRGYDYTFYDKDYLEKDGGVYDDPEFTIEEAAGDLLAEEGISIHDCKVMDFEELMECVENAEKEQQAEPSLTYYVAECMEFSVLGEYHADLTIDEAFDIYKRIPSDRMNGGKGIGICLQEDSLYAGEYPLMRSDQIDMETLEGIPYMKNHPLVQQAVKEMEQRGVKLWYPIKEAQAEKGMEQRQEQPQRESKKESVLKALKERQERLKAQQTEPKRPERSQSKKKGDMEL